MWQLMRDPGNLLRSFVGQGLTEEFRMLAAARRHLTYANVMATVALFVALGGVSYATIKIGRDSVRARHIAPNAVRASELARRSVGTAEVTDGSLLSEDFLVPPRGVRGARGDRGATGPPGARGPAGPRGADGVAGVNAATSAVVRLGSSQPALPGEGLLLRVDCLAGERAIGGGASPDPEILTPDADLKSSFPYPSTSGATPTAWMAGVQNTGPTGAASVSFRGYVVCLSP